MRAFIVACIAALVIAALLGNHSPTEGVGHKPIELCTVMTDGTVEVAAIAREAITATAVPRISTPIRIWALKAAQDLGISLEDVTSAALGNSAAMASVNEQLAPYIAQADMTASAGDTVTGATQNWSKEVGTLREALGGQNKDLADAMEASKRQAEATGHATEATDAQTVASQAASVSLQDEKSAADQLKDSLDALNGKNINLGSTGSPRKRRSPTSRRSTMRPSPLTTTGRPWISTPTRAGRTCPR